MSRTRTVLRRMGDDGEKRGTVMWRVGRLVPINVYDGDRPVCQCHNEEDAVRIVRAMNSYRPGEKMLSELELDSRSYHYLVNKLDKYDAPVSEILAIYPSGAMSNYGALSFRRTLKALRGAGVSRDTILASPFWNSAPLRWKTVATQFEMRREQSDSSTG